MHDGECNEPKAIETTKKNRIIFQDKWSFGFIFVERTSFALKCCPSTIQLQAIGIFFRDAIN